jgi:excinuclease ABC subunit B
MYEELAVRVEFFGDEVERLSTLHPVTGEVVTEDRRFTCSLRAITSQARSGWSGLSPASRLNWPTGWSSSSESSACLRPSDCGCAPATTSR